jgi:uncharacterized membrane protein
LLEHLTERKQMKSPKAAIQKLKNLAVLALVAVSAAASTAANAALDTQITTAISEAKADSLMLAGAMTAMVAIIWGAMFLKKKFFG